MTTLAETPQELLTAAYGLAAASQASNLVSETGEGLRLVSRVLTRYYQVGAQVAPSYFSAITTTPRSAATGVLPAGWMRPAAALVVLRLEASSLTGVGGTALPDGTEVVVVPVGDRAAHAASETGEPAVYEVGQRWVSVGTTGDPASGSLLVYYATGPQLPTSLTDPIDPTWPRAYNDLLIYELAGIIARKEGRDADAEAFGAELDAWRALYIEALQTTTTTQRSRFADWTPPTGVSRPPVSSATASPAGAGGSR